MRVRTRRARDLRAKAARMQAANCLLSPYSSASESTASSMAVLSSNVSLGALLSARQHLAGMWSTLAPRVAPPEKQNIGCCVSNAHTRSARLPIADSLGELSKTVGIYRSVQKHPRTRTGAEAHKHWWPGAESQNAPQPAPRLTFPDSSYLLGYTLGYTKLANGGPEIRGIAPRTTEPPKGLSHVRGRSPRYAAAYICCTRSEPRHRAGAPQSAAGRASPTGPRAPARRTGAVPSARACA